MSIIIPVAGSTSVNPSSFDSTNSAYDSVNSSYPISNGYNPATNTTRAQFNITKGANAQTWIYYVFASPNIPNDATVTGISCQVKAYISNQSNTYVPTRTVQLYTGTTAKGTAKTLTTTVTTFTFTESTSDWTISQLNNARAVLHVVRGTSNTSTNYYVRFYGATLTINYTVDEIGYEVKVESSLPNTKGVYATPEYQAILASDTSTLQDITINNKDGLNLTLSDNGTKITSFTSTSYTYSIASLTTDHLIKVDLTTSNFSKINDQWRSIAGVYQKSSGAWSATTFNSAFPSGTMIKQGNDIGDEVPLVKFLSNCDVVYCAYYADDETTSSVGQRYRWDTSHPEDAGATYYLLSCTDGYLGLHKVVIPALEVIADPTVTTLLEYGQYSKIYLPAVSSLASVYAYISGNGTSSYSSIYNGTIITLKLKTNSIQNASELESLITSAADGGIKASYGKDDYTYSYLYNSIANTTAQLPCYILTIQGNVFGLASVDSNMIITPILGFRGAISNSMSNRSAICLYGTTSNIYYSGGDTSRTQTYGGGSFFYM